MVEGICIFACKSRSISNSGSSISESERVCQLGCTTSTLRTNYSWLDMSFFAFPTR